MSSSIFRANLMQGQVCLVTGGGTGIGRAIGTELAVLGATVILTGRRAEPVEATAAEFCQQGWDAHGLVCDIRDEDRIEELVKAVLAEHARIDVLVNNAGGQFPAPAAAMSNKGFAAVVRNNLLGTWQMTREVATAAMIPAKRGHIVNITADVRSGFPGMAHTGAARAGVENLTKTLAIEWAQHGLRINAVAPGIIATEALSQYPAELMETSRQNTPLRRFAAPEEVAHLVVYLASPFSDFVTGQVLRIDGGKSLWGESWPIPAEVPQHAPYPEASVSPGFFRGANKNASSTDKK